MDHSPLDPNQSRVIRDGSQTQGEYDTLKPFIKKYRFVCGGDVQP